MSLILDALKKIEQEKARRQVRSLDLGPDILKERTRPSRSPWRFLFLIAGIVVATAGFTAVLIKLPTKPLMEAQAKRDTVEKAEENIPSAPKSAAPAVSPPYHPPAHQTASQTPPTTTKSTLRLPSPPADVQEGSTPPQLTVSGIAWQDDRSDRRAVVNGVLVSEGSVVAGARVREILPDRVRFTVGNRAVEAMNSSPFH